MNTGNKTNKADNVVVKHIVEKRFGKNVTTGAFVGRVIDDVIIIGWSRVNVGMKDKFDSKEALNYANYNALMGNPVPESMQDEYAKFVLRCKKFFKNTKIGFLKAIPHDQKEQQRLIRRANKLNKEFDKLRDFQNQLEKMVIDNKVEKKYLKEIVSSLSV